MTKVKAWFIIKIDRFTLEEIVMTAQQCFEKAKQHYDRCLKFIDKMSSNIKKNVPEFRSAIARTEFDIILQYILLRTALADGSFKEIEGEFIDKITVNFDIITLFRDVPKGLNWKWIGANQSIKNIENVINELRPRADEYIEDFINWFSMLDQEDKEFDLLEILCKEIGEICVCFVFCDGKRAKGEIEVAGRTVAEVLSAPWKLKMD